MHCALTRMSCALVALPAAHGYCGCASSHAPLMHGGVLLAALCISSAWPHLEAHGRPAWHVFTYTRTLMLQLRSLLCLQAWLLLSTCSTSRSTTSPATLHSTTMPSCRLARWSIGGSSRTAAPPRSPAPSRPGTREHSLVGMQLLWGSHVILLCTLSRSRRHPGFWLIE